MLAFVYCAGRQWTVMKNLDPPPKMDPPVQIFRNIWTPGPDVSKYLDPHGTNISEIG